VHVNELRRAEVVRVQNELVPMQRLVGGYIEALHVTRQLLLVCNEHGKLEERPVTFVVNGEPIAGPFFFTAEEPDGEGGYDLAGLREDEALLLAELLNRACADGMPCIDFKEVRTAAEGTGST
jgi:hypothetical protein